MMNQAVRVVARTADYEFLAMKRIPPAIVPGKPRNFARRNGSDLAEADTRDHAFEPGTLRDAAGGAAQVVIDDFDLPPAEFM